jgi:hypothetical protein
MKPTTSLLFLLLAAGLPEVLGSCICGAASGGERGEWVELFDGRSLDGWTPVGGRYDGAAHWRVEDGALVGSEGAGGAGGLLYTLGAYDDFELELEARLTYPFDSGIFLRMRPPETGLKGLQVTLDHRPGGEVGAIYADGYLHHNPEGAERVRTGDWNRYRVSCRGEDAEVVFWINGEQVTRYRLPAGSEGFARSGLIGLQVHGSRDDPPGSRVSFRNLRVRRLE